MRFQRLDLLAFGHFTEVSLDLSGGDNGLHLVFGRNEAGKSSSLRALTDFLYGIPNRTTDSFLHAYVKMRIGGTLTSRDGRVLQCIRRKAHQSTLRGPDDVQVIADSELTSFLGDVDRDLFCTMFGIDHAALRRGGEELSKGAGQLGTSLFSSASGLAGLRDLQSNLAANIERVFKPSGRSGSLVECINAYKAKKDRQKETQVTAEAYDKHVKVRQEAIAKLERLDQNILEAKVEKSRLERIDHALKPIASWRTTKAKLDEIGDVPLLPEDFAITSSRLITRLQNSAEERDEKQREIEDLDRQLQQLPASGPILSLADRIDEVIVRLGEYRKGKTDEVRNEDFRKQYEREARNILRTMGRPDDLSQVPESLRIPSTQILHIQSLGNKFEGLSARVDASIEKLEEQQAKIRFHAEQFASMDAIPTVVPLCAKLSQIQRQGDLETQSDRSRKEIQELELAIQGELQRLPLWNGVAEDLAKLAPPSLETIERVEKEWSECDSEIKSHRHRKAEAERQQRTLERELTKLEASHVIPTELELNAKRSTRDLGWNLIRREWREGIKDQDTSSEFVEKFSGATHLSEAFEASIADADRVSDQLRSDADRVANKSRILVDLEQLRHDMAEIGDDLAAALEAKKRSEVEWGHLWQPFGIPPLPPREMRSWAIARSEIVESVERLHSLRMGLESNESRIRAFKSELIQELEALGIAITSTSKSLQEILEIAEDKEKELQSLENDRRNFQNAIEKAKAELVVAETARERARAKLAEWKLEWGVEMERLGLESAASPDQANAVLSSVNELFQKLHEADTFRKRNAGIERDAKRFVEDTQQIAMEVGLEIAELPVEQLISRLKSDLYAARQTEELRERLVKQRASAAEQLERANTTYRELRIEVEEACRLSGSQCPEDLPQSAERSRQRREQSGKLELLTEQIQKFAGLTPFEDFLVEVEQEAVDSDSIAPRMEFLENRIRQFQAERDGEITAIGREESALKELDRQDEAAGLATECESIAATVEDQLRELAVLRVCSVVLASGIERFREKNQDPMLVSAAAHFRAMTCNRFSGLRADLDDQGNAILVGLRANTGEAVCVSQMSDGTCDQLYLALRLASLESWLQRHEPIPFVVDDILLNFDNERALATLERLAEFASHTQVIFFTHHRHLVEMAERHLSAEKFFVHELP